MQRLRPRPSGADGFRSLLRSVIASYCIYLVHPFLEFLTWGHLIGLLHHLDLSQIDGLPIAIWRRIVLTLMIVILASIAIHVWVESPLTRWFRGLLSSAPLHAGPNEIPRVNSQAT